MPPCHAFPPHTKMRPSLVAIAPLVYESEACNACSPRNEVTSCDGLGCVPEWFVGDGECDQALNCTEFDNDHGDCCPKGQIRACDGETCVDDSLLDNEECNIELACEHWDWDQGWDKGRCWGLGQGWG